MSLCCRTRMRAKTLKISAALFTVSIVVICMFPDNRSIISTYTSSKKNSIYPKLQPHKLAETKCIGSVKEEVEDLFCLERPKPLQNYKNPCWKDEKKTIRCIPYFHLGTDKCGTTDLFLRIKQHPDVLGCSYCVKEGKEAMYWAWDRYGFRKDKGTRSFSQYVKLFTAATNEIEKETVDEYHHKIIGDASPMDFWDFRGWTQIPQNRGLPEPEVLTPHLMRHMYTDFKMILIFRDPVDRLYSDYFMFNGYRGATPEDFHKEAVKSVNMMRDCLNNNSIATCFFSHHIQSKLTTRIYIGCYSVFLKVWLSVFPRENFLFLRTEDYKEAPEETFREIFEFLQIRPLNDDQVDAIVKRDSKNVNPWKKKAPPMLSTTRALLSDFYRTYNDELADILMDERFLWDIQ